MISKFIDFVKVYSKIETIDESILEIVNTGFKSSDNFSLDIPIESELYINKSEMKEFCDKQTNNDSMIPITLDDPRLTEYIKIYKDMKTIYIDNCEYLLNLLEREVLVKTSSNKNDENNNTNVPHFTIKNIGYAELVEIETNIRNKLVTMYSGCHEQYQKGIMSLYKALQTETQV